MTPAQHWGRIRIIIRDLQESLKVVRDEEFPFPYETWQLSTDLVAELETLWNLRVDYHSRKAKAEFNRLERKGKPQNRRKGP